MDCLKVNFSKAVEVMEELEQIGLIGKDSGEILISEDLLKCNLEKRYK